MDVSVFEAVMGASAGRDQYQKYLDGYVKAMKAANITTVRRAAMFAAQIGHESYGLRYMEELADGSAYEGRRDLGNTIPGDGRRFKGRGPIQLTGRANYRRFTEWANSRGFTTINFVANPEKVSEPEWGFLAAAWYWTVARPSLNGWADAGDVLRASREINGWVPVPNGLQDRTFRYERALKFGERLLPKEEAKVEKIIHYSRDQVTQDTGYYCGPASTQTIIKAVTGVTVSENTLAKKLGTHTGGTDWVGVFPKVLNEYLTKANYVSVSMPKDPPTQEQKDALWKNIVSSIDADYGVVANIVAPPNNYPVAVWPSKINPQYGGGTVYHYIAVMGYSNHGQHKVWVADSGFYPYGYWLSFDQLCSLIPPKGYAYAQPTVTTKKESAGMFGPEQVAALHEAKVHARSADEKAGKTIDVLTAKQPSLINNSKAFDLVTYVRLMDAAVWESRQLMDAVARKVGLDPDEVVAEARARDNKKEGK